MNKQDLDTIVDNILFETVEMAQQYLDESYPGCKVELQSREFGRNIAHVYDSDGNKVLEVGSN